MKGMYLGKSVKSMSISRTSGMNHASSIVSCSKWKELLEDNGDDDGDVTIGLRFTLSIS